MDPGSVTSESRCFHKGSPQEGGGHTLKASAAGRGQQGWKQLLVPLIVGLFSSLGKRRWECGLRSTAGGLTPAPWEPRGRPALLLVTKPCTSENLFKRPFQMLKLLRKHSISFLWKVVTFSVSVKRRPYLERGRLLFFCLFYAEQYVVALSNLIVLLSCYVANEEPMLELQMSVLSFFLLILSFVCVCQFCEVKTR